jgi:RNA polymerase sigma-70 factor (ECF subfamily)
MESSVRISTHLASDERAIVGAPGSREQAFRGLVDDLLGPGYRLASVLLGDRVEAEDAVHDAVVRAWRSFGDLRDPARFGPWFQRIVVNICRDRLRQRQAHPATSIHPDMVDPTGSTDPASGIPERDALQRALHQLSPDHRIVIVLRFYADLSIEQIADRLGQRTGTVKSRLHHAVKALRAAYDAGARESVEPLR